MSLESCLTNISALIIECQQDSIEIVNSVQEENSKKFIIINAIYMEVENQMQLDRVQEQTSINMWCSFPETFTWNQERIIMAYPGCWKLFHEIAILRKLTAPFPLKNIQHGRKIAVHNLGEKMHVHIQDFSNGYKSLLGIKKLLSKISCLSSLWQVLNLCIR